MKGKTEFREKITVEVLEFCGKYLKAVHVLFEGKESFVFAG